MLATSDFSLSAGHSGGSKLPIDGLPASVAAFFIVEKNLGAYIRKALIKFQDKVRSEARASWGDAADTIHVLYDDTTEEINIFSTSPRAHVLEYGSDTEPPHPVLRKAAYAAQQHVSEEVTRMITESLK